MIRCSLKPFDEIVKLTQNLCYPVLLDGSIIIQLAVKAYGHIAIRVFNSHSDASDISIVHHNEKVVRNLICRFFPVSVYGNVAGSPICKTNVDLALKEFSELNVRM